MNSYSVSFLLLSHIKEFFQKLWTHSDAKFPNRIGEFTFISSIKKVGVRKSYKIALYKNAAGKKAIGKLISAKIKGYHYLSLKNEATMYSILHAALMRVKKSLPKKTKLYYIPELLGTFEDKERFVILIEFVDGIQSEAWSNNKKYDLYFSMSDFIQLLGTHLSPTEKKKIAKRNPIHYLMLYPLLVAKSLITYPQKSITILSGIPTVIAGIPSLMKNSQHSLIHRDLHFMNMLVDGKRVSLIDLQQCVIADPMQEAITLLRYEWENGTFYPLLLQGIQKRFGERKNFVPLFKLLSVNSATHGLAGSGFNKKIVNGWDAFITFANAYPAKKGKTE